MIKYWVNTNKSSVNNAFMAFARNKFSKYKGCCNAETYAEINKEGSLAYVYEVSNHFQSTWSDSDVLTFDNKFSKNELYEVVRFYVGLIVPHLKKRHTTAIANLVITAMSEQPHSNSSDWYITLSFYAKIISFTQVAKIATDYLKDKMIYREKNEFITL